MKIVGQAVVGPGEADRYLELTLKEFKRLCDDVVVATCHATKKELKLLDKYDIRHYADDREWGLEQPNIKTDLLKRILTLSPDWILPLDADETLPTVDRQALEEMSRGRESCFFYVVNLWNDEQHYRKSMAFWNVRFYKADPTKGVQFLRKPVHCGNAPPYFYNQSAKTSYVPHILLHRGLMKAEDRQMKFDRYDTYDPRRVHKGEEYYNGLLVDTMPAEYNLEQIILNLKNYVLTIKR